MPSLVNMVQMQTASNFQFSGVGIEHLDASEYTLATIVVDTSGSVDAWQDKLADCIKEIVKSGRKSPRAENFLVRVTAFNDHIQEIHGFQELSSINLNSYSALNPIGGTALFDAIQEAIDATITYATQLSANDYLVNAVIYVLTDGENNAGNGTVGGIKKSIKSTSKGEKHLESLAVILIGVGYDANPQYLDGVKNNAGITQFVDMTKLFKEKSPANALALLAGFVSKSFSTTSQALQSGNSRPMSSALVI